VPRVTLKLRHNPKTGKRDLVVEYESEEDLLPHEHERDHRRLVEGLIGRSLDTLGDIGEIRVEREGQPAEAETRAREEQPSPPRAREAKREPQGGGSG
jgi:hypothetical protein